VVEGRNFAGEGRVRQIKLPEGMAMCSHAGLSLLCDVIEGRRMESNKGKETVQMREAI